jgi:carbohydrate kinase (thermoresistant glucokinase family)
MPGADTPRLVVMGVSAVGKSSVAAGLSAALDLPWIDADSLHPAQNVAKMAAGIPLDDADRWPWLDLVGHALSGGAGSGVVVACSALRRVYRDRLRRAASDVRFVHLVGDEAVLLARSRARPGHFMPPTLIASQLATLEHLEADEDGIVVGVESSVRDIVDSVVTWSRAHER